MKKIITLGLILFLSVNSFAQKLSLTDLQNISNKTNWEYVNQYLMKKGWEFYDSEKESSSAFSTITWSYNKSSFDDKAEAWFQLFTFKGIPNKISYSVYNKPSYTVVHNSLSAKGYKLTKSKIEDNKLVSTYTNKKFILRISTERSSKSREESNSYSRKINSITTYEFTLIKRFGIYDRDNGKKTIYFNTEGGIRCTYTLKNGKQDGMLTIFHYSGGIELQGNYSNGKANGTFTEYNMSGKITSKYTKKNNLKEGLSVGYVYKDDGELFLKEYGQYFKDEKNGTWKVDVIDEGKERLTNFTNYKQGIKEGPFQEAKGDSLIIGNYKNNKLTDDYKIYYDVYRLLDGGIISTDTNHLELISDGEYCDGEKSGYWRNYDITGALRNEGRYLEGKKIGEWKYYYSKWSKEDKSLFPYSEKLYLIQNFSEGYLDGKETRYFSLDKEKYTCAEVDENNNPLDTCTRFVCKKVYETVFYKNNKLNGPCELKDSTNQVVAKGMFINGLKEGKWFHRYTQKANNIDYFIYQEGSYSKGDREGSWIQYEEKNKISRTFNYKQGELNGKFIEWNNQKNPEREYQFNNGQLKELIVYDSLGINPVDKYEIYEANYDSCKCRKTHYFNGGYYSQEYWIKSEGGIDYNEFELTFLFGTSNDSFFAITTFKDGYFKSFNENDEPIITGNFFQDKKTGLWIYYDYKQHVKIELTYKNDLQINEKYLTLNGDLFSGKFILLNEDKNIKEIRKIKKGLRNGKTLFIELSSGKTIKKEKYKNGIKK